MVKNFGGKNGKKIARKNAHSISELNANKKIRFANGTEEIYGIVTKCLGNGHFLIMCNDQKERLCVLRNKFTGRNKHSNLMTIGSWVIIGLREWETTKPNKKDKCDMLEVYTNNEKYKLLEECKVNLSFLTQQENILLNIEEQEDYNECVIFSESNTNADVEETGEFNNDSIECENLNDDMIDIDDI
jgi:initiation factor 1A